MNSPSGARPAPASRYKRPQSSTILPSALPGDPTTQVRDHPPVPRGYRSHSKGGSLAGFPLVRAPEDHVRDVSRGNASLQGKPSYTYMENGTRWMEKQETRSLRQALQDMDLAEDTRLHHAAQDEAAALVWKHQNPDTCYSNPDLRKDYRSHLRKGSYNYAHTSGAVRALGSRSSSSSSQQSCAEDTTRKSTLMKRKSMEVLRKITPPSIRVAAQRQSSAANKPYGELAEMVRKDIATSRRTSSGGSRRIMSGSKKGFMHPDDKIWEDDQETAPTSKLFQQIPDLKPVVRSAVPSYTRKNPFARVRMNHDNLEHSISAPPLTQPAKPEPLPGPPIASRDPMTSLSDDLLPTLAAIGDERDRQDTMPMRDGIEIRSNDIRAATSKRRSDRSPNLPQPTIVSDRYQRPIVSFQPDVLLQEGVSTDVQSGRFPGSSRSERPVSASSTVIRSCNPTTIPTINLPDEDDISATNERSPSIPIICLPDDDDSKLNQGSARPPIPHLSFSAPEVSVQPSNSRVNGHSQRPLPVPYQSAASARTRSTPHYSPSMRHSGILCAHCALAIAGRVLSAAGQRFHPGCFVCHQCNTNLELVAFYPEPENKRQERISRIRARQSGCYDYTTAGECEATALQREAEDGDESPRFYCHLDFHELYSPRCKSCKTPIEGEVIIACGAEWHAGHFFCAQCGDPFDSTTPFVEKDGYAWCVGCHTNRYSSKCRKCRKPVTDVVVKALGSDWHSQCFCCMECNGSFDDGRYFLRGEAQEPVCVGCEERRLKA